VSNHSIKINNSNAIATPIATPCLTHLAYELPLADIRASDDQLQPVAAGMKQGRQVQVYI
jgi:hypothetical protein